jgi:ABC-2 type transport system ATP-binding protein
MQKRVSLACALVHRPQVIFLDEPTAAVDPHLRFKLWELFRGLAAQGITHFVSTHLMEEAVMCDQVAVLRRGKIIANDTPENILEAGRSRLSMQRLGRQIEQTISATPEALAKELRIYGLAPDIETVSVTPDSLEDVILDIIQDQDES